MKSLLQSLRSLQNVVAPLLDWIVILLVAALVLDVLWGVFTRFIMGAPSRWTEEFARYTLVWVALLGAAVAFRKKEHLGFDYVMHQLDSGARKLLSVVAQLVVIAFAALVMVYGGYVLVSETLATQQVTPALGVKMGHIYLALPICGCYVLLFSLVQLLELLVGSFSSQSAATGEGQGE